MTPARRRATALVLVGVALAVACTFLGRWQWHRHEWRDAQIAIVEANYGADPVPLGTVLGPGDAPADDDVWTPVTAVGSYDAAATVLLRNRPVAGTPGYHVLVPFVVRDSDPGQAGNQDEGTVVVVDRGWVPTGEDATSTVALPDPPAGEVTLVGRVRADEPASDRSAPAAQVQAISVPQVLAAGGLPGAATYAAYLQRVDESPAPESLPGALPAPSTDPGSHLSYAFQWWTFALGALLGLGWLARREVQDERAAVGAAGARSSATGGPGRLPGEPPAPGGASSLPAGAWGVREPRAPRTPGEDRPRRRGGRAEDEEDALIDAQLASPADE